MSIFTIISLTVFLITINTAAAQFAPAPYHTFFPTDTPAFREEPGNDVSTGLIERVQKKGASWIQLKFSDYNLGTGVLIITSIADGQTQRFNAESLRQWGGLTAAFNGDAVDITIVPGPTDSFKFPVGRTGLLEWQSGESGVFYKIEEVRAGRFLSDVAPEELNVLKGDEQQGDGTEEALCDDDDRVGANEPRVGRIMPIGCTGWIIDGSKFLTAGHCVSSKMQLLQFNVPQSAEDGTPIMPSIRDQYAIVRTRITFRDEGRGNDWAIFTVIPNTETGIMPEVAQGGHFEIAAENKVKAVSVVGFGLDDTPMGPQPPNYRNVSSQTQQITDGDVLRIRTTLSAATIDHYVDTKRGNSGSPIIMLAEDGTATNKTIGIHTHGKCNPAGKQGNGGTSFLNPLLMKAIKDFK
jgi:V8-like Glu-specific endopeptidase